VRQGAGGSPHIAETTGRQGVGENQIRGEGIRLEKYWVRLELEAEGGTMGGVTLGARSSGAGVRRCGPERPRARRVCLLEDGGVMARLLARVGQSVGEEGAEEAHGPGEGMGGGSSAFTVPRTRRDEVLAGGEVPAAAGGGATTSYEGSLVSAGSACTRSSCPMLSGMMAVTWSEMDATSAKRAAPRPARNLKRGGGGGVAVAVRYEMLAQTFHMPIQGAARQLGVGPTTLKKICRAHGIRRWPYRTVRAQRNRAERLRADGVCAPPAA